MTDLSDPAIREAAARALYVVDAFAGERARREAEWDHDLGIDGYSAEPMREAYRQYWDRLVAELKPILHRHAVREQLRGFVPDVDA